MKTGEYVAGAKLRVRSSDGVFDEVVITQARSVKLEGLDFNRNYPVDPTTIEGFKTTLGRTELYDKPKNFKNTFVDYNIANVETVSSWGHYRSAYYVLSGSSHSELTSPWDYYICNGGEWPSKYVKLRYPYPVDFEQMVEDAFPVKISFTQYDINENGFWNSLYRTMSRVEIKESYWASSLFSGSSVPMMKLIFNPKYGTDDGTTVRQKNNAVLDCCFDYCTNLKSATLVRKGDSNVFNTLSNVFRHCYSLSALTFESLDDNDNPSNEPWRVGQLSGTFEYCGNLKTWPSNFIITSTQSDDTLTNSNDKVAQVNFTFEGSGFQTIGSGEQFNVGLAQQCFNGAAATTVNCTMDMKFIHPNIFEHTYNFFGDNSQITNIELKNINHDTWYFDGTKPYTHDNVTWGPGKFSQLDQASVEYLFYNLYDLTSNVLEENIIKRKNTIPNFNTNNGWAYTGNAQRVNDTNIRFTPGADGTATITGVNGKFFKFKVTGLGSGEHVMVDDGTGGSAEILSIDTNKIYYIEIETNAIRFWYFNGTQNTVNIEYLTSWDGAVDSVSAASLYCPVEWDDRENNRIINDSMVRTATTRGWMVYVGGERRYPAEDYWQLEITPTEAIALNSGGTASYTATYKHYYNGSVTESIDVTNNASTTWSLSNTISSYGIVNNGLVTITSAPANNVTGYVTATYNNYESVNKPSITVQAPVYEKSYTIELTLNDSTINKGSTTQCSILLKEFENQGGSQVLKGSSALTPSECILSASNASIATVNNSTGVITGVNSGTTKINLGYNVPNYGKVYDGKNILVNWTDYKVVVSVDNVEVGGTATCTAYYETWVNGTRTSNQRITNSQATWTTDNTSVLTVNNNGVITGVAAGRTYVNCTYNGVTGSKQVTVSEPATPTISVSPWNFTGISANGDTRNPVVKTTYQNWKVDGEPRSWISISPTGGTGSGSGDIVTVEVYENTSSSSRGPVRIYFSGTVSGEDYIDVQQLGVDTPRVTAITLTINSYPAVGAGQDLTISSSNVASLVGVSVYGYFTGSGNNRYLDSNEYNLTCNTISFSNRGKTEGNAINKTLTITATTTIDEVGKTDDASCTVTQEANVKSTSTIYGDWYLDYGTEYTTSTEYDIYVQNSSITDLTSSSGNRANKVSGLTIEHRAQDAQSARTVTQHTEWTSGEEENDTSTEEGDTTTINKPNKYSGANVSVKNDYDTSFITDVTTGTSGTIRYSANGTTSSRDTTITYYITNDSTVTGTTYVEQAGQSVTLTSISVEITDAPMIHASGGSVNCSNPDVEYSVTANYSDGHSEPVSAGYTIDACTAATASNRGTTPGPERNANTHSDLQVRIAYGGKTATASRTIRQEANVLTPGEDTRNINQSTSAWTEDTGSNYDITVSPATQTVSSGAGSVSITVVAHENISYDNCSCPTWQVETKPWSAYTATGNEKHYGQTSVGPTQYGTVTRSQGGTRTESTSAAWTATIAPSGFITNANLNSIDYTANPDATDTREATVTYCVVDDARVQDSIEITQLPKYEPTPTGRNVKFNILGNTWENDSNHGDPMTITAMTCKFSENSNVIWTATYENSQGLTPAANTHYPDGQHWTISSAVQNDSFWYYVPYGTRTIQFEVEFDQIKGQGSSGGMPTSDSVVVSLNDSTDEYNISLPIFTWQNL